MVRPLSLLLATGLFAASALAQAPYLVRDLNATTPNAGISSTPSGMTLVNGRVVLIAATPDAGRELRVMENGKVSLLRDIVPGPASSSPVFIGTDGQGTAYFTTTLEAQSAFDKDVQLWRTDGTAAGTRQVRWRSVRPL